MIQTCLFCKGPGPFNTVEHIIPESLGNDSDTLKGVVCDKCQNYLSREVEKPALHKTPFSFWRVFLGIKSKRSHLPSIHFDPQKGGKIPAYHPSTDSIGFTAQDDWSTSVNIDDPLIIKSILNEEKTNFEVVLSPWHLNIMGRFLGKMGLEYIASNDNKLSISQEFDDMRRFIRYGAINWVWPIYWGTEGELKGLKGPVRYQGKYFEQDIECYRYSLGTSNEEEHIFVFSIGLDIFLICLTHRIPKIKFKKYLECIELKCVHYPDNSW
jgi:HNH endonuclease